MTVLSARQIGAVAQGAGFTGRDLVIAIAVCLAESGGKTDADNTGLNSDGSVDRGLWQINSVHADLLSTGAVFNPEDNARMAFAVWKSQGWHGWSTYNNGAYLVNMPVAQVAASNLSGVSVPTSTTGETVVAPASMDKIDGLPVDKDHPPYTVVDHSNSWTPNDQYHIIIGKTTFKFDGDGKQFAGERPVPRRAVNNMFEWMKKYHGDDDYIKKLKSTDSSHEIIYRYFEYVFAHHLEIYKPTGTGGLENIDDVVTQLVGVISALVDAVKFLSDGHNLLRVGLFIVGGGLALFALSKLAGVSPSATGVVKDLVK